jgi:sugar O-acyltransferase (sialic acid O-acetyltransferase NeuD family)
MNEKAGKIVIVGDSPIAEVAFEYFTHDSPFEVVAFTVNQEYLTKETLFNLPVVPFETVEANYDPAEFKMFVAVGYTRLNRVRAKLFHEAKAKGFTLISYISSRAFVWHNVEIGENCFIFENNVVQPFVKIGDNVTLWSGNHIGHHSTIHDHCFIASHVVISGFVEVGEYCFMGVNATVANNVTIKRNCLIGASAIMLKDSAEAAIYGAEATLPRKIGTVPYFRLQEHEL